VRIIDSRAMRLTIPPTSGRTTSGTPRLSDSDTTSTWTPVPTCLYCQYELSLHRNP
jgi:hypothetical protein